MKRLPTWLLAGTVPVALAAILFVSRTPSGEDQRIPFFAHALSLVLALVLGGGLAWGLGSRRRRLAECTEKKLIAIVETSPDGIVLAKVGGGVLLANRQIENLFGCPLTEVVDRPVSALLERLACESSDRPHLLDRTATQGAADEQPISRSQRPDGTAVLLELSFRPLQTSEGLCTLYSFRDVTAQRLRERRRAARHTVRRVLEQVRDLNSAVPTILEVLAWAADCRGAAFWVVAPSEPTFRRLGTWLAPQPTEGDRVLLGIPPTVVDRGEANSPAELDEGGDAGFEFRLGNTLPTEGANRSTEILFVPITFAGELLGVIALLGRPGRVRDEHLSDTLSSIGSLVGHFVQRKRNEEAIRWSEARKAAILEASLDAIVTCDTNGAIVHLNPAAEQLFGRLQAKAVGGWLSDLVPAAALNDQDQEVGTPCKSRLFGKRLQETAIRADGRQIHVEVALTQIPGVGAPLFTAFIRDLTELKQAEEARRRVEEQYHQAQKIESIGRLAGGVAHDFNNLLTVINGYGEVLLTSLPQDDPARDAAEMISQAGTRAARLVRQLLAFGKKQFLQPRILDLNRAINDLSPLLRELVGGGTEIVFAPDPRLGKVTVDESQIEQVLMNLTLNARDAMTEGGILTIETANVLAAEDGPEGWARGWVLLRIRDTGCGMDGATQARIFEPFFTTKTFGQGSGLGLASVHGIIEQSGGRIEVESAPGCGTTFSVYLPPAAEEPRAGPLSGEDEAILPVRGAADPSRQRHTPLPNHVSGCSWGAITRTVPEAVTG